MPLAVALLLSAFWPSFLVRFRALAAMRNLTVRPLRYVTTARDATRASYCQFKGGGLAGFAAAEEANANVLLGMYLDA